MNGIDVYNEVTNSRDMLKQLLSWAQEASNELQPATMIRDISDYTVELDKLIMFLHHNTSNSLVFRKNVLNIIFKNSNLYNVQMIARILRFIQKQSDEIMTMLESVDKSMDMAPLLKTQEKLKLQLTTSYTKLENFIDKLQLILTERQERFEKKDEIATTDLQDIREISNVSELSFEVKPKKSFLPKFLQATKKTTPISVISDSNIDAKPKASSEVPPASNHRKNLQ